MQHERAGGGDCRETPPESAATAICMRAVKAGRMRISRGASVVAAAELALYASHECARSCARWIASSSFAAMVATALRSRETLIGR
jgi:hypothetical protein